MTEGEEVIVPIGVSGSEGDMWEMSEKIESLVWGCEKKKEKGYIKMDSGVTNNVTFPNKMMAKTGQNSDILMWHFLKLTSVAT